MVDLSLFLRALKGENTPTAPMWMMRQAGRYLPEYLALKEKYSFWEMVRTPELAAEVSLQPMRRFDLDAAIIFSDIMTPLVEMGVEIEFSPGPVIANPIRTSSQIDALRIPTAEEAAPFMKGAIQQCVAELAPKGLPLIGFAGAPLTLATYLIQGSGSKDYEHFRAFLKSEPVAAHLLLEKLTEVTIRYLRYQIGSGVSAIQLFDSWAGLHDGKTYNEFSKPYNQKVFDALKDLDVPRIYLAVGSSHLYPEIATLECEAISVDWRLPLSTIRKALPGKTLQGNLDPSILLAGKEVVQRGAIDVLTEGLGGAHVFNLGHGISRFTPIENVHTLIDTVHNFKRS